VCGLEAKRASSTDRLPGHADRPAEALTDLEVVFVPVAVDNSGLLQLLQQQRVAAVLLQLVLVPAEQDGVVLHQSCGQVPRSLTDFLEQLHFLPDTNTSH